MQRQLKESCAVRGDSLEDYDLATERGEHGSELHPDHAPADDREPLWNLFELDDGDGIDGVLGPLQRYAGHR